MGKTTRTLSEILIWIPIQVFVWMIDIHVSVSYWGISYALYRSAVFKTILFHYLRWWQLNETLVIALMKSVFDDLRTIINQNFVFVALISDTYVKLTLMSPTGQEVARSKTSIRRGQPNPLFKEAFMFQVALFQLAEVTLMVSVYNKRSMKKKDMIGWFALGKGFSYICVIIQYGYVLKSLWSKTWL